MEGGQKNNISLESGLDIKSSDMFIPAGRPLFQHNRQRYQGHCLPTSLRYEHDGWAAGEGVYTFKFNEGSVKTTPAGFTVIKYKYNDNPAYIFAFEKTTGLQERVEYAKLWFNMESELLSFTDGTNVSISDSSSVSKITGTFKDQQFTIIYDSRTGSFDIDNTAFQLIAAVNEDGKANMEVIDKESLVEFNLESLYSPESIVNDSTYTVVQYTSFDGEEHKWGDVAVYDGNKIKLFGKEIVPSVTNGRLTFSFDLDVQADIELIYVTDTVIPVITDMSVKDLPGKVSVYAQDEIAYAQYNAEVIDNYAHEEHDAKVSGYLPVWSGLKFESTLLEPAEHITPKNIELIKDKQFADKDEPTKKYYLSAKTAELNGMIRYEDSPIEFSVKAFDAMKDVSGQWQYDNVSSVSLLCNLKVQIGDNEYEFTATVDVSKYYFNSEFDGATLIDKVAIDIVNASGVGVSFDILEATCSVAGEYIAKWYAPMNTVWLYGDEFTVIRPLNSERLTIEDHLKSDEPRISEQVLYNGNSPVYIVSFYGRFQSNISMLDVTSYDNKETNFTVAASSDDELAAHGIYIDRDTLSNSQALISLEHKTITLDSGKSTHTLSIVGSNDLYLYYIPLTKVRDEDNPTIYVPSHFYYGDVSNDTDEKFLSRSQIDTNDQSTALYIKVVGTAKKYSKLNEVTPMPVVLETKNHRFWDKWEEVVANAATTITEPVYTYSGSKFSADQDIILSFDGHKQQTTYDIFTGEISGIDDIIMIGAYQTNSKVTKFDINPVVSYLTNLHYDCTAQIPYAVDNRYTVYRFDEGNIYVSFEGKHVRVNIDDMKVYYLRGDEWEYLLATDSFNGIISLIFSLKDSINISAIFRGMFNSDNLELVSFDDNKLVVSIDGINYVVDISSATGLMSPSKKSTMDFYYTDVTDENLTDNLIQRVETDKEMQFLKQQWNTTVEVENFWWVDKNHILELTKHKLTLKVKTDRLDDWDADVWEVEKEWIRYEYITTDVLQWLCSCAYGGTTARFITLKATGSAVIITVYNPLADMTSFSVTIPIGKRNLGSNLVANVTSMWSYNNLQPANMLSASKISATVLGNFLLLGIHYDNNLQQWAIRINLTSHDRYVLHGYGYVGIDGLITGGEIPAKYFNVNGGGYTATVQPISYLTGTAYLISSLGNIVSIKDVVVGNDSQQWYISQNIPAIVSHVRMNTSGGFSQTNLNINNNYSSIYRSPSFYSRVLGDFMLQMEPFTSMMPSSIGGVASIALEGMSGGLQIYFFAPLLSTAVYLQQTLGQYAYVHYNYTGLIQSKDVTQQSDTSKDEIVDEHSKALVSAAQFNANMSRQFENVSPESSDEISFDIQNVRQVVDFGSTFYTSTLLLFGAMMVSALDWVSNKVSVNELQSQEAISDEGRKYSQMFLQNIMSMSATNLTIKAQAASQTSEVTAVKTLDMFYSTSDGQKIHAGPGYVNHNFVAQCVAQSVVSTHAEFSQIMFRYTLGFISKAQLELMRLLNQYAVANIRHLAEYAVGWFIGAGLGIQINIGYPVSMALNASAYALEIQGRSMEVTAKILPDLLEAIGDKTLIASVQSVLNYHNYDVEAKHNYGSKSEVFMYPCFNCSGVQYTNESVVADVENKFWMLKQNTAHKYKGMVTTISNGTPTFCTEMTSHAVRTLWSGYVSNYIACCRGQSSIITLPEDMACVTGVDTFLPQVPFKNENIGESEPVFPVPVIQDYIINKQWRLSQTTSASHTVFVSCGDTKLIDGLPSNIVLDNNFCGVACSYTAIEVKKGLSRKYLRPWAITPQVLALNQTGFNCCYDVKAYHGFDGYGYRLVSWYGSSGMNKEQQTWQYSFLRNDRFKRSNKMPFNQFLGNFQGDPTIALTATGEDRVYSLVTLPLGGKGLESGAVGEQKDVFRYSLPIFTEFVSTLPAAVKALSTYNLAVIDGITGLVSDVRNAQSAYKAPMSIDFSIGKNNFRVTSEYICSLGSSKGVTIEQDLAPTLGLTYIGSTPSEAYFYSQATRQYYTYQGGSSVNAVDTVERFRNIKRGLYDFINQEVLMPCLATFNRLDKNVQDDENETDNIVIPRIAHSDFIGEVAPPIETIFNTRSWFKTLSLPSGVVYQGPNRCIINRFVVQDYMIKSIKGNYGLWKRVPREEYHPFREYAAIYEQVDQDIGDKVKVKGWTHNPFLLVTSPLGMSEETDCRFEWEITFAWPVEMDKLYGIDDYAVVNIWAETMTPGGKVLPERPVHVFLHKELFTRTGNYGYYSFRYQSTCGAGNRERLHIWSDQYIAISSLQLECKPITQKRTEVLTQQVDVQTLHEI